MKVKSNACGFLYLNKPAGITTFQLLRPVKKTFKGAKVGHAGTLDKDATGLVIVGVGPATRLLSKLEAQDKFYEFRMHLGKATDTGDASGETLLESEKSTATLQEITEAIPQFLGEIQQIPPKYSALKIDGKRASDRVRAGEEVEMKARPITIHSLELLEEKPEFSDAAFRCHCTKGTYIRSLARDLGEALASCAHASGIHRTGIGIVRLDDAVTPDSDLEQALIPVEKTLADLPIAKIDTRMIKMLRNGVALRPSQYRLREKKEGSQVLVCDEQDAKFLAYAEIQGDGKLAPKIQLNVELPENPC